MFMRFLTLSLLVALLHCFPSFAATALLSHGAAGPARSATPSGPSHQPRFSADGRFVLFVSGADDLAAASDNGPINDVFVFETATGAMELVSVRSNGGGGGNGDSRSPRISADGRYVVFVSDAANLVANDTNGLADVFFRDRLTGSTRLISRAADGLASGNGESLSPTMTLDGSKVVFESDASNLVPADNNGSRDVFVWEQASGTLERLSTAPDGTDSLGGPCKSAFISGGGEWAAYLGFATNLVLDTTPALPRLYLRDLRGQGTVRMDIPAALGGKPSFSDLPIPPLMWNGDGTRLLFEWGNLNRLLTLRTGVGVQPQDTLATPTDAPATNALFGWTLSGDGLLAAFSRTNLIHLWNFVSDPTPVILGSPGARVAARGTTPQLDRTGTKLAFVSTSPDLDPTASDGRAWVHVADLSGAAVKAVAPLNRPGMSPPPDAFEVSADGARVVFESLASDLVENDRNGQSDVFIVDVATRQVQLVSRRKEPGTESAAFGWSRIEPGGLSRDGRTAVFVSTAEDLVAADNNGAQDVFVVNLDTRAVEAVSVSPDGLHTGSRLSTSPALSGNGRRAAFISASTNLVPSDTFGTVQKLFVRDLQTRSTRLISTNVSRLPAPVISDDGNRIAFVSAETPPVVLRYDWTNDSLETIGTAKAKSGDELVQLSGDGSVLAYYSDISGGRLAITNSAPGGSASLLVPSAVRGWHFPLSLDGRAIVYPGKVLNSSRTQILLSESGKTPVNLSVAPDRVTPAKLDCAEPVMDDSGAFVAFTSASTNLVANVPVIVSHVYWRDVRAQVTRLVSVAKDGVTPGNSHSRSPGISADGRYVLFWSRADNLVDDDTNAGADYFVRDMVLGTTRLVGRNPATLAAAGSAPVSAMMSRDGSRVVYTTFESGWGSVDLNNTADLYVNMLDTDTDADGMGDDWERRFLFGLMAGPGEDPDGDGVTNVDEWQANTNPMDPLSFLELKAEMVSPGSLRLHWVGMPERRYRIESSAVLSPAEWRREDFAAVGTGAILEWTLGGGLPGERFYRLAVVR